jgi:hypothetical protein
MSTSGRRTPVLLLLAINTTVAFRPGSTRKSLAKKVLHRKRSEAVRSQNSIGSFNQ